MRPAGSFLKFAAVFVPLWGCVGYALGTATLLGPVRWVTRALRAREAGDGVERLAVLALIAALVAVSAGLSFVLARRVLRSERGVVRFGIPAAVGLAAVACVWVWMTPSLMGSSGREVTIASSAAGEPRAAEGAPATGGPVAGTGSPAASPRETPADPVETTGSPEARNDPGSARPVAARRAPVPPETRFVFGPYPERERLAELKAEGFDAVVALLHPAVVPFEPKLLARERKAAGAIGLELIHLPMLPWVGDNEASLDGLRALAERPGNYYVHCYLGRDRVRVAQAVVQRALDDRHGGVTVAEGIAEKRTRFEDGKRFERGVVRALESDVFLTPYPTDEEFAADVVARRWGAIVTLLDPENKAEREWIEREREILARYGLELTSLPIATEPLDPPAVLAQVERARALPRPLLVHHFLSYESGKAPAAEAFLQAWHTGLPPVPPSLFREPLAAGSVRGVAPNVLVGPRPSSHEYGTLFRRGIRAVLYVGADAADMEPDREAAARAPLPFAAVDPNTTPDWAARLADGGPWYVYGPDVDERIVALAARFGPAVPDTASEAVAARGEMPGRDVR